MATKDRSAGLEKIAAARQVPYIKSGNQIGYMTEGKMAKKLQKKRAPKKVAPVKK